MTLHQSHIQSLPGAATRPSCSSPDTSARKSGTFIKGCALAASLLACSSPVLADPTQSSARRTEVAYLALSAIDAGETISCLNRGQCEELNPLFGKHPSTAKIIAAKVVFGALHFALFEHMNDEDPKAALRFAQISAVVQGGVVLLNLRVVLK